MVAAKKPTVTDVFNQEVPNVSTAAADQVDTTDTGIDQLNHIVSGNNNLVLHPHLVTALMTSQATPQQAQAINYFVGGMQAQQKVLAARTAGLRLNLTSDEKAGLTALNMDYSDVEYSPTDALPAAQAAYQEVLKSKDPAALQAVADKYGVDATSQAVDQIQAQNAAAQKKATDQPKKKSKWGVGRVFHDVTHPLDQGYNVVSGVVSDAMDVAQSVTGSVPGLQDPVANNSHPQSLSQLKASGNVFTGGNGIFGLPSANGQEAQQMTAQGYDPTSVASVWAYRASGRAKTDLTDLDNQYGNDMVSKALTYMTDPKSVQDGIVGNTNLSASQVSDQLKQLQSPQFVALTRQLAARQATPGNQFASVIDPVKHPGVQAAVAGTTDLIISFLDDPSIAALNTARDIKMSKVLLDGVGDQSKVYDTLTGATKGVKAAQTRQGVQYLLNESNKISEANAAGDKVAAAASLARIHNAVPQLEHLLPDFQGSFVATGIGDTGEVVGKVGAPITTMDQAADYLSSRYGAVRFMQTGQPFKEGRLMPGQLSRFGAKKLRGAMAAGAVTRSLNATDKAVAGAGSAIQQANTVKTVASRLINLNRPNVAVKMLAQPDDAARVGDGAITGVPEVGSTERGDAIFASRTVGTGTSSMERALGALVPPGLSSASRARFMMTARKLTSYLPSSYVFDTANPDGAQQVVRYAKMFLPPGDSYVLGAKYASGDEGVRKAVLQAMHLQTLHAAGAGSTEAGRTLLDNAQRLFQDQKYSNIGNDLRLDVDTGEMKRYAIWGPQAQTAVHLTDYKTLTKINAKLGLWENTVGRMFNSQIADHMMSVIKAGWLITGTNIARNALDDLTQIGVRGMYWATRRAKAVASDNDLLPQRFTDIIAQKSRVGKVALFPLQLAAKAYRRAAVAVDEGNPAWEHLANYPADRAALIAPQWSRLSAGAIIDPDGATDITRILANGDTPTRMVFNGKGYEQHEMTEDLIGADRWSNQLAMRINPNPQHWEAVISHLEDPAKFDISSVAASLVSPENYQETQRMKWASQFIDDNGVERKAVTQAEKEAAVREVAQRQADEARFLLTGADGNLNKELIDYVRQSGRAPTSQWLMEHAATLEQRPRTMLAPAYEGLVKDGSEKSVAERLSDVSGRAYQQIVEHSIQRITTLPIFWKHYGQARVFLEPLAKSMAEDGLGSDAIEHNLMRMGEQMAYRDSIGMVDNPGLKRQFDVIGRNFFAFSRAQVQFFERWSKSFIEDPARLRKLMLVMEGSEKTGLVWTDTNGQKQFIFPGSAFAINALQKVESALPGVNLLHVPVASDLTGNVLYLQPGMTNPTQVGLTPFVNLPLRQVYSLFPQYREQLDEVDSFFNTVSPTDEKWYQEFMPSALKKFTDALNTDDKDSLTADAMRTAILNLEAAGKIPAPNADPGQQAAFIADLRTQVKNQMLLRAVFGLFAPAPPSLPSEMTAGSRPDEFAGIHGVKNLDDEFKQIVDETGGDYNRAAQIWAELHPDKLAYTVGTTVNQTKSSVFGATQAGLDWMQGNLGFMKSYKDVAAYFIPASTQDGPFNLAAYHAEFQIGLRQHKDTSDYFQDVATAQAASEYYAVAAARDANLASQPASRKTAINNIFAEWKKGFMAANPLFSAKLSDYTTQAPTALGQVSELRRLVANPTTAPKGTPLVDVQNMLAGYDAYHAQYGAVSGDTNIDKAKKKSITANYNTYMNGIVKNNSSLAGLYQGVFHTIDGSALDSLYDAVDSSTTQQQAGTDGTADGTGGS